MNPTAAPSLNGLARPAAPTGQIPVSPSGAPGVPQLPQGTIAPTTGQTAPTQFNTGGALDAVSNYYNIPRQTAIAAAGVQGNKFNATSAYEGKLQLESTTAQKQLDPSAYKIIQGPNGKTILDPITGQQVSIGQYVAKTGANPAEVLADSPNPQDQQFVQDFQNYETFLNAAAQKGQSKEQAQVYQAFISANKALANLTPQQASNLFLSQYGSYFGLPSASAGATQTPTKPYYTPQYTPSIEQYVAEKGLFGISPIGSVAGSTQSSPAASIAANLSSQAVTPTQ